MACCCSDRPTCCTRSFPSSLTLQVTNLRDFPAGTDNSGFYGCFVNGRGWGDCSTYDLGFWNAHMDTTFTVPLTVPATSTSNTLLYQYGPCQPPIGAGRNAQAMPSQCIQIASDRLGGFVGMYFSESAFTVGRVGQIILENVPFPSMCQMCNDPLPLPYTQSTRVFGQGWRDGPRNQFDQQLMIHFWADVIVNA